jgi:flagellar protein FlgJ
VDLRTAERLAFVADPKAVAALEARRDDPAVAKAVAEQFGTLLLQRVMRDGGGQALAMAGGTGGDVVNTLFADTIAQTAMSGDRLGLADMLFRAIAATQPAAARQPASPPPAALPPYHGFPLSPYWQAGGLRPLAHGPTGMPIAPPAPPAAAPAPPPASGGAGPLPGDASRPDDTPAAGAVAPNPEPSLPEEGVSSAAKASAAEIAVFARRIGPALQWAAARLGVSPRVLLAQAALESGWGRSVVGNNVFGIKAGPSWSQARISAPTHEIEGGRDTAEPACFRAYPSLAAAVEDYVSLITGSHRYRPALGLGDDARAYGQALVRGGYATDSAYADKLAEVAASPALAAAMAQLPQAGPLRLADRG